MCVFQIIILSQTQRDSQKDPKGKWSIGDIASEKWIILFKNIIYRESNFLTCHVLFFHFSTFPRLPIIFQRTVKLSARMNQRNTKNSWPRPVSIYLQSATKILVFSGQECSVLWLYMDTFVCENSTNCIDTVDLKSIAIKMHKTPLCNYKTFLNTCPLPVCCCFDLGCTLLNVCYFCCVCDLVSFCLFRRVTVYRVM